ncbi:MAG: hypothetical protein JXC36_07960 [Candidatus Atribacteria bacterium]|nr:hypothetical protein [Candidatus Atribacteria bacterium]
MKSSFICLHCGGTFLCNPHVKDQQYCNDTACRQARRRAWKLKSYRTNKSCRQRCLNHQKTWRKQRPVHEYQREYRESHPEYVKRNREMQQERNRKRQKVSGSMIVNRNTLSTQSSDSGTYALMQIINGKIVNRNTCTVRLQVLSGEEMILAQNSVRL